MKVQQASERLNHLRQVSDQHFEKNARAGLLVYLLGWLIMVLSTDFYFQQTLLCLQLSGVLIGLTLLRYLHTLLHDYLYWRSPSWWMALHYALLLGLAAFWSSLYVLAIVDERFSRLLIPLIMLTTLIAGGAVASFRSKFFLPQVFVAILLIPAMIVSLLNEQLQGISELILLHWLFLAFFGYKLHKDYLANYEYGQHLAEQQRHLDVLAKTDSLTKIYNRQYFTDCYEYQWQLAIRNGSELALLMVEVDDFRTISFNHGPVFSDECLIHVAQLIREGAKRVTDLVVRYGGEQFVLILSDTDAESAQRLADTIRQNVQTNACRQADRVQNLTVTIGIGVIRPKQFSSSTLLIQKAEIALYQAKIKGKNRVESM